jgi:hypothetical protein
MAVSNTISSFGSSSPNPRRYPGDCAA